ncbi:MAG: hypothetical protein WC828_07710 [Thermoleophilia bacterium]|jgi:hypothetical protein
MDYLQSQDSTFITDKEKIHQKSVAGKDSRDSETGAGRFCLYKSPWRGDAGVCLNGGVTVDAIMVLRQAPAFRPDELLTSILSHENI